LLTEKLPCRMANIPVREGERYYVSRGSITSSGRILLVPESGNTD
jgi:hypothetical protein